MSSSQTELTDATTEESAVEKKVKYYLTPFTEKLKLRNHVKGCVALSDLGVCPRCVIRFTNQKSLPLYQEKEEVLNGIIEGMRKLVPEIQEEENKRKGRKEKKEKEGKKDSDVQMEDTSTKKDDNKDNNNNNNNDNNNNNNNNNNNTSSPEQSDGGEGSSTPRQKSIYCPACLGILQDIGTPAFLDKFMENVRQNGFEFAKYSLNVAVPSSILIRQQEIWYYLRRKFGKGGVYHKSAPTECIIDIKEVAKWIIGPLIVKKLGYQYKSLNSDFKIHITYHHPETAQEYLFVLKNDRKRKRNQDADEIRDSVSNVFKTLRFLTEDDFIAAGKVPPAPIFTPYSYKLSFEREPIFIGGRYNKYARNISQSPWAPRHFSTRVPRKILSVEEMITPILKPYFNCSDMIFSASGREDIDVRMLGDGRPFLIEVRNPRRVKFSPEEYKKMQDEINQSTSLIQIRSFQRVGRNDVLLLKDAEENKKKHYRCIVWLEKPIKPEDLDFLKELKDMKIEQKTPVRVLHRRSLATRVRLVHSIKAEYINSNFLRLDLITQAGTYVKEFIHGDFGRTSPNFGSMMNTKADILQLDVMKIDVEFPLPDTRQVRKDIREHKMKKDHIQAKKEDYLKRAPEYAKEEY
eukprot:TRINITY_DN2448_c0_g1_i1.p1 TRINITY_DN2448_c0_g1~~TRINITY_DN2448_c0_g1_i1.p1  ORF type:complete len:631 (-),score=147.20 TRINITY_DN2448_c0_g1_i1:146-2038(-)